MTPQEIAVQVAIAQRNAALDQALQVAVEANVQRERADALQKELDAIKQPSKPKYKRGVPPQGLPLEAVA